MRRQTEVDKRYKNLGGPLAVFLLWTLTPAPAQAYLDPGTGNMLVYLLASLAATMAFFAKNILYAIRRFFSGKEKVTRMKDSEDLVIFSEGKIYWGTFKPIVEALLQKDCPFRYLTMDLEDPGLTIEHARMNASYIGSGSVAFARAANVRARVMLVTTPNIGTPGYPMPVPAHVAELVHVMHSVGGLAMYRKHAFDTCTTLLLRGDGDVDSVRLLEQKRALPARECVSAGVPYLDGMAAKIEKKSALSDPAVILVAPSWGEKNCLHFCGLDFLHWLAEAGYSVIVRPHPHSLVHEKELIDTVVEKLGSYANVRFDFEVDGSASLSQADLLISDKSGIRFDFAFLYERPVFTFDIPMKSQELYEISELDYVWENDMEQKLGPVVTPEEFLQYDKETFLQTIAQALTVKGAEMAAIRGQWIVNFGQAGPFVAGWLIQRCGVAAEGGEKERAADQEAEA